MATNFWLGGRESGVLKVKLSSPCFFYDEIGLYMLGTFWYAYF